MRSTIGLTLALGALLLASSARAHVTLQPNVAPSGEFFRVNVRVPNERDNASTEKIDVQLPDGFLFVSYEPAVGWKIDVTRETLGKPVKVFGREIAEQVSRITFTAVDPKSKIAPGEFRDFGLSVRLPERPGAALTFKALQTYDSGEVVRWIGPPESEEPAPQVKLAAAEGQTSGETEAVTASDSEGGSDALAIVALAVGALGLGAGGWSLALSRRRQST